MGRFVSFGPGKITKALATPLVIIAVALTAACNSSAGADPESRTSASSEGSESQNSTSYPLTLKTPYGSTVLKSEPKRVAIAGQVGDTENVLSLGVIPVLAPKFQLQWPWIDADDRDKIETQDESGSDNEVPLEQFAASKPDVIIATTDTNLESHYDKLSQIAPVVAISNKAASTQFDWQQSIKLIAEALNRNDEATEQINTTNEKMAAVKKDHPEFAGKSISFTIDYGAGNGRTFYNGTGSPGEEFLTSLGFDPADHAGEFTGERPQVSDELLPQLDSDVMVVNYNTGEAAKKKLESDKIFASIPAVKDGRYVGLLPDADSGSSPLAWSMARPTAINLQWSIDYLVPKLVSAAKATE